MDGLPPISASIPRMPPTTHGVPVSMQARPIGLSAHSPYGRTTIILFDGKVDANSPLGGALAISLCSIFELRQWVAQNPNVPVRWIQLHATTNDSIAIRGYFAHDDGTTLQHDGTTLIITAPNVQGLIARYNWLFTYGRPAGDRTARRDDAGDTQ